MLILLKMKMKTMKLDLYAIFLEDLRLVLWTVILRLFNLTRYDTLSPLGRIHLYERETQQKYRKRYLFRIPDKNVSREYDDSPKEIKTAVHCIRVNQAQVSMLGRKNTF